MWMMYLQVHVVAPVAALTAKLAHQPVKARIFAEVQDIGRPVVVCRVAILAGDDQKLPGTCCLASAARCAFESREGRLCEYSLRTCWPRWRQRPDREQGGKAGIALQRRPDRQRPFFLPRSGLSSCPAGRSPAPAHEQSATRPEERGASSKTEGDRPPDGAAEG